MSPKLPALTTNSTADLLAAEPVSDAYRTRLRADLGEAELCRFAVAYVSDDGLNALGPDLVRVMRDSRSLGVASIACSTGYQPLLKLNADLGEPIPPRLKYFMETFVPQREEKEDLRLLHSKIVYLAAPNSGRAVVYAGSHNWSQRALGPRGPRNAEVSIRFEERFDSEAIAGQGTSISAWANRHIQNCFDLPLCIPATRANKETFSEWVLNMCTVWRGPHALEEIPVILAVLESAAEIRMLKNRNVYFQVFDRAEGQLIWGSRQRALALVWETEDALKNRALPSVLLCEVSASNAGPQSDVHGTNASANPISGFAGLLWDKMQRDAAVAGQSMPRGRTVQLPSGPEVAIFDLVVPAPVQDSQAADGGSQPEYQFHFEVRGVGRFRRFPLFFSEKRQPQPVRSPGFHVSPDMEISMLRCLREVFGVEPRGANAALPYSGEPDPRAGRRVGVSWFSVKWKTAWSELRTFRETVSRIREFTRVWLARGCAARDLSLCCQS
jgi:hypothetical protein